MSIFSGGFATVFSNMVNLKNSEGGLKSFFVSMVSGFKAMTAGAWAFISTPIGAAITALVAVGTILKSLFSNFSPIVNKLKDGMAALNAVFTTIKDSVLGLITGQKSLSDTFENLGKNMGEAAKQAIAINKLQRETDKLTVQSTVSQAKYKQQIDELLLQSKNRTLSEEERMKLIDKSLEIEQKAYNEEKKIADNRAELAFQRVENGRNLTDEEKKQLREQGVAYAQGLKKKKEISKDEIQALADALANQADILDKKTAIEEKAQNRRDVLEDKAAEKAAKSAEKAKKTPKMLQKKKKKEIRNYLNLNVD